MKLMIRPLVKTLTSLEGGPSRLIFGLSCIVGAVAIAMGFYIGRPNVGIFGVSLILGGSAVLGLTEAQYLRRRLRQISDKGERLAREHAAAMRRLETLDLKKIKERFNELERQYAKTEKKLYQEITRREIHQWVSKMSGPVPEVFPAKAGKVIEGIIADGMALQIYRLLESQGKVGELTPSRLRQLRNALNNRGYLIPARKVAKSLVESGQASSGDEKRLKRIDEEIKLLEGRVRIDLDGPPLQNLVQNRVLHVVGNSLPSTQTGYTLRTHRIARAQAARGFDVHVVTRMGYSHEGADDSVEGPAAGTTTGFQLDGVEYHRLDGPMRGTLSPDEWLVQHSQKLDELVRRLRPAVLHAASDFHNPLVALPVARATQVPLIYECRGFWEETWLSRQARKFGWQDLHALEQSFGLPDVYRLRREIEDSCRHAADHVVTLDDVMVHRIVDGGVDPEHVSVVPNAVDPDDFQPCERDGSLAAELGIHDDVLVIGYVSSLVEYEGIDCLIDGFCALRQARPDQPLALLIVGDGRERSRLERHARSRGVSDVIFTGRVDSAEVARHYSLIDIFVVPRLPVEVCHLVTPLKPFEAFSLQKTVVMSDVRALASIAQVSEAAELFQAGNPESLAATLTHLLDNPDRGAEIARRGREWVLAQRTWDRNAERYERIYAQFGSIPSRDGG